MAEINHFLCTYVLLVIGNFFLPSSSDPSEQSLVPSLTFVAGMILPSARHVNPEVVPMYNWIMRVISEYTSPVGSAIPKRQRSSTSFAKEKPTNLAYLGLFLLDLLHCEPLLKISETIRKLRSLCNKYETFLLAILLLVKSN